MSSISDTQLLEIAEKAMTLLAVAANPTEERSLCHIIKRHLDMLLRRMVRKGEQRVLIYGRIQAWLKELRSKRVVYDYKAVSDASNQTDEMIEQGHMVVSINVKFNSGAQNYTFHIANDNSVISTLFSSIEWSVRPNDVEIV